MARRRVQELGKRPSLRFHAALTPRARPSTLAHRPIGAAMAKEAIATLQSDTPEARVTHWFFPPGSATGHHRHEFDYVVVPLTDGALTAVTPAGRAVNQLAAGKSYFRKAGVEHDIVNETQRDFAFVEIEIKP